MKRVIAMAFLSVVLTSCATGNPPPRINYYQLPEAVISETDGSVGLPQQRVILSRVSTTDILAQTGIVTAAADARVITANYHHWSELPELALQRSLSRCLQTTKSRQAGKINLQVDAFHSDGAGGSQFGGQWSFAANAKPRAAKQYRFRYRESLHDDGYPALVTALSKSVGQLCQDIEAQLR